MDEAKTKVRGNGQGTKEDVDEKESKVTEKLDNMVKQLEEDEGDELKTAKDLFEDYTGSENLNQKEERVEDAVKDVYKKIVDGYKHTDFVGLDIEPAYNNKRITNRKVVKTSNLEKRIVKILDTVHQPYKEQYVDNLRTKYIHTTFDLANKVISNEIKVVEEVITTNNRLENRAKDLLSKVIERDINHHGEFAKLGAVQDKANEELEALEKEINDKKTELDTAYSNKKYERIRGALEKDLLTLMNNKQDQYDMIDFTVSELERLSKSMKRNNVSQEKIKTIYQNNRNINRALNNIYNSLKNAKEEKYIVDDMKNIDNRGTSSKQVLKNSINTCENIETYTEKSYDGLGVTDKEIDNMMKGFYQRDSEIKTDGIKDTVDLERINNKGYKIREQMKKNQYNTKR